MSVREFQEVLNNIPLFLGGIFMIYLAAVDFTLFDAITQGRVADRTIVALATVVSAAVPMFFAVGLVKVSLLTGRETIFYYEKLLRGSPFWVITILLLLSIAALVFLQGRAASPVGASVLTGCILLSIYLGYYLQKRSKT